MSLGAKIRAARKAAGLTQISLATTLGVNRATISKYESGQIELTISHLCQIAKILGVGVSELIEDN